MRWEDYEFITDLPVDERQQRGCGLTGWESIVFELEDDAQSHFFSSD